MIKFRWRQSKVRKQVIITLIIVSYLMLYNVQAIFAWDNMDSDNTFNKIKTTPADIQRGNQKAQARDEKERKRRERTNARIEAELEEEARIDAAREDRRAAQQIKRAEIEKAVQSGDPNAQYILGAMYYYGTDGISRDCNEAFKLYLKAAEQDFAPAQVKIGLMFFTGKEIPQDYNEAVNWFKKSAEQGILETQKKLGVMYSNGIGVIQDYKEAYKWSFLAAAQGDKDAIKSRDYIKEKLSAQEIVEIEKAAAIIQQAAAKAVTTSNNNTKIDLKSPKKLSAAPQTNLNQTDNLNTQEDELTRKAESGDANAQYNLGEYYYKNAAQFNDRTLAFRWYSKAAKQGHSDAQFELAKLYYLGLETKEKKKDSDTYGEYETITVVPQNSRLALNFYRKAAEQGHPDAQYQLSEFYFNGLEMTEEIKGERSSEYDIGKTVTLVPVNYMTAYKWCLLAKKNGYDKEQAAQQQAAIEQYMTPAQKAKSNEFIVQETDVKQLLDKAQIGDVNAQYSLGLCYATGKDVIENKAEAAKWFGKVKENIDSNSIEDIEANEPSKKIKILFAKAFCSMEGGNLTAEDLETAIKQYSKIIEYEHISEQLPIEVQETITLASLQREAALGRFLTQSIVFNINRKMVNETEKVVVGYEVEYFSGYKSSARSEDEQGQRINQLQSEYPYATPDGQRYRKGAPIYRTVRANSYVDVISICNKSTFLLKNVYVLYSQIPLASYEVKCESDQILVPLGDLQPQQKGTLQNDAIIGNASEWSQGMAYNNGRGDCYYLFFEDEENGNVWCIGRLLNIQNQAEERGRGYVAVNSLNSPQNIKMDKVVFSINTDTFSKMIQELLSEINSKEQQPQETQSWRNDKEAVATRFVQTLIDSGTIINAVRLKEYDSTETVAFVFQFKTQAGLLRENNGFVYMEPEDTGWVVKKVNIDGNNTNVRW